ncbi:MAG: CARDB domain-containing protein, partial [bacterium]|nr:CARDB domain-containing protein [bacterium]
RTETDETNNALTGNAIDIVSGIDAIMTAVSAPASGATGTSISLNSTVKNQGVVNMSASYIGLYISTDSTITTSDTRLGTAYIASLAAGASRYSTTSVAISSTLAPGQYYIGAIADYSNVIKESDETNNVLVGNPINITPGADVIISAVSGPLSGATGTSISITSTVKNQGVGAISTSTAGIYISTDSTITTSDTRLGTAAIASLAAGASGYATTSVAISSTLAPGQYYIGAIADYNNARKESDETNNALVGNIIDITPGADAIITAVSGPLSGITGASISITSTVKNQGIGTISTSTAGIYISTDANITTSDTRLGTAAIASLAAGASSTVTKSFAISSTLAPGQYYIGAIADYNNARKESDETNNALVGNTIDLTKP